MGKFLKILRYIANLIATMGNEFSNPKQKLAAIGINPTDLSPEECVWDEINVKDDFKDSTKETVIDKLFPNGTPFNMSPFFLGSGPIPPCYPNGTGTLYRIDFDYRILSPDVSIHRAKNGFIILVNGKVFLLPNFILFLKGDDEGISHGDFLNGIAAEEPRHYKMIWEILNRERKYKAMYHVSLFGTPLNVLKTVKNWMTGEYISWSDGQFLLDLRYNGTARRIKSVLFRKKQETIGKISFPSPWNLFMKDPILQIGDDEEYHLPDYIRVLRGEITEEQFIQALYRLYSCSVVEKILEFLTDRHVLYCSTY
jgi:hypothetical protein